MKGDLEYTTWEITGYHFILVMEALPLRHARQGGRNARIIFSF